MAPPGRDNEASLGEILHPPGYRPRLLHYGLVFADLAGRVHPLVLTPVWLALVAIVSWPWGDFRVAAAAASLAFVLIDSVGLALLPRLERSFGPVTSPLLALTTVRGCLILGGALLSAGRVAFSAVIFVQLGITAVSLYATWIEPSRIGVTCQTLQSPKLNGGLPLRLLHISDIHVERITARERKLLDLVETLPVDLIVLTGDYLNLSSVRDPEAQAQARCLLEALCERAHMGSSDRVPIYAITGSPPVDLKEVIPSIFAGLPIDWLLDEAVHLQVNGHNLRIAGLQCTRERSRDAPRLRRLLADLPDERFTLLLYHSPDLMPEATECGVDLYLCGHTHGGQIRLPLLGAVLTSSDFWKRYEMGRYQEKGTTLFVSRGLGMEGLGAPRARFLCPPEIIEWTLSGGATEVPHASDVRRSLGHMIGSWKAQMAG